MASVLRPPTSMDPSTPEADGSPQPNLARRNGWADVARTAMGPVWSRPIVGAAVATGLAASWGVAAGWWTPRSPSTTPEAVWSILLSLTIGASAGFAWRTRWALVLTPVAFAAVYELVRLDLVGPTVDAIHLSGYGLIALVVGRGFHALLTLVPLALGAALGAGAARALAPRSQGHRTSLLVIGRTIAVLTSLALVALSAALLRPARTDPIVDADGNVLPGSIAELTTVDVGGHDLRLMIRGHSVENPVLLFLAGGPGGSELGAMRRHLVELEEHFTVVTWDQRGSGRSYPELDPTATLTLEGMVDDTIEVTDHLRARFGQDRIYLLGQSWGTTLGVLAVQQRPDLFAAFIGTGQMVSQRATDRIFYDDTLEWARANDRRGLVDELESIGPPPYDTVMPYEAALSYEQQVYAYDHAPNAEGVGQMSENLFVEEYALIDQIHVLSGFLDTFAALYPQLQDIDFRVSATTFDVPMFFVQGAHEADGRQDVFAEWYPMIDAPTKDLVVLDTSGHRPLWEQPDEFVAYLIDTVLPATR